MSVAPDLVHAVTVQAYRVAALSGLPAYLMWSASGLSTFPESHTTAPFGSRTWIW